MQINLKQSEIVEALKQYVGGQGINLKNKAFSVTFTAGRKEGGLLADISIETVEGGASEAVDTEAEKKKTDVPELGAKSDRGPVTAGEGVSSSRTGSVNSGASVAGPRTGSSILAGLGSSEGNLVGEAEDPAAVAAREGFSDRPIGQIPVQAAVKTTSLFN